MKMLTFLISFYFWHKHLNFNWRMAFDGWSEPIVLQSYQNSSDLQKNQFHHLIPYAFEFLQSVLPSSSDIIISIVKHQGFILCGTLA